MADATYVKGSVENLTIAGTAEIGTGNEFANILWGNDGPNTLDGGAGADTLHGLGGNDTFFVDNVSDVVFEGFGGGVDTVHASVSHALSESAEVEFLKATQPASTVSMNLTGSSFANTIIGNAGVNILDGRAGADVMRGLGGDDTYIVDDVGDVVDELGGDGLDAVQSWISYGLGDPTSAESGIEQLVLLGDADINGKGNSLSNVIVGNPGVNIVGGGLGNDFLSGGGGSDWFVFDSTLDATDNVDHVTDFVRGDDKLQLDQTVFTKVRLGALKKDAFFAKGNVDSAKDKQDRIIYDKKSGELYYDPDGKGGAGAVLFAVLDGSPNDLKHKDFLVIA